MKVSILGNGLTSLTLAKTLINLGVSVDIFYIKDVKKNNSVQTLGISKTNIEFFNKYIMNIKKFLWNINKIEIFSENLNNEKILKFQNKKENLFSIIRYSNLYDYLLADLKKNKLVKFKKSIKYKTIFEKEADLIFNCDSKNLISKKFFYKKINKDYDSLAHITIFKHKSLTNNHIASQIFTKKGPIAFLPISSSETSVVYSVKGKKDLNLNDLIKKYNTQYEILKIYDTVNFELKSSNLRTYSYKNILAFGDMLHRLHPLAGQGFNMTIRDIKEIYKLIQFKIDHGLALDNSIFLDFEKNTRNRNYLFSSGIDFIYEFFNFENKIKGNVLSKSVKFLGNSKIINKFFIKFADNGIII